MNDAGYEICHSIPADIEIFNRLCREAKAFQERNHYPFWDIYAAELIQHDITNGYQYKIMVSGQPVCFFSYCPASEADKKIWNEMADDRAMYLHRIVADMRFKGLQNVSRIVYWATQAARVKGIELIRLDTWADNPKIITYYQQAGFRQVGLSGMYALMEMKILRNFL